MCHLRTPFYGRMNIYAFIVTIRTSLSFKRTQISTQKNKNPR